MIDSDELFSCTKFKCGDGFHVPECYDYRNQLILSRLAAAHDGESVLLLKCFNRDEAQKAKDFMQANYPSIPFTVSWLDYNH